MIYVTILGTSGMTPLPDRHLSSCLVRYQGTSYLIDAGEGTQIAIKKMGYSLKKIDYILFTHYHTDHIGGLVGLLASMSNSEKTNTLTIIGPKGLNRIVDAAKRMISNPPFMIKTIEIIDSIETLHLNGLEVTPFPVKHGIACFGYKFILNRDGKCDVEKAKANDVPMEHWSAIQQNNIVIQDNRVYTKDLINSLARKGIKFVYTTDTRPCPAIEHAAKDADLFICEGMYGEPSQINNANKNYHMTMQEAASIAASCHVKELILTHYSPSIVQPSKYLGELRYVFRHTTMGIDGMLRELTYSKE